MTAHTPTLQRNPSRARSFLSTDEIRRFTARSNLMGAWALLSTWSVIALSFAALAYWPNPLTFLLVVGVLGGRQLALAILGHEAAHRTLFRHRGLNDWAGDWLAARWIWNDVPRYRIHHMRHHAHTGTEGDPDLSLVAPFPTTRRSLWKKVLRDLTGVTGVRRIAAQVLIDIGVFEYTVAAKVTPRPSAGRRWADYAAEGARNMAGVVLTNALMFAVLALIGHAWLYAAWGVAYLTTFSLFIRLRSIAEHACMARSSDPLRNTRTTRAGWLARMTVAPFNVNFHLEHHLLAAVPWFRLPALHRHMRTRHGVAAADGYLAVLRTASGRG
ncbi:fatty acid desaturase family protein [Flagellatimonas centrodinii]|uniref:fatty acid desaturase family protein n=1 Tax=Flagellatimonas centrodinii TaxID=2806210 RepID=UPI001FFC1045|nr:fatty acid desaturase family protein [Flagellatimonas centrodinii]ULQ47187.1 fatty acid desaturase family protein [Flagellatimonas centrodinii]